MHHQAPSSQANQIKTGIKIEPQGKNRTHEKNPVTRFSHKLQITLQKTRATYATLAVFFSPHRNDQPGSASSTLLSKGDQAFI